ncbi:MAG: Peptide chain release factor N(5)-glutamine methyltransferase (EC [uncultured Caballeronia sp.]|nr:MAG: Peptide chain release factor N(5)-glutamine methyltransferase (EC [uncultured Caballeronia sp.]
MTTVAELLRASALPALETRILLEHVLGWWRTELITRDDEELAEESVERFEALAQRRAAGEPIAQLVGTREFFGLEFEVAPDVLIPRPETELLVEIALEQMAGIEAPRVLDLGTGSGAITVGIAFSRDDAQVWAVDRSAKALAVAARNASRLLSPERKITLLESNWTDALEPALRFEVIVSNPPYIAQNDPHLSEGDLRFEPRTALTDETDGLAAIRTIIQTAPFFLATGGSLWLEHGYDQAADVRAQLTARGFSDVRSERDLAGIERVSGGFFTV